MRILLACSVLLLGIVACVSDPEPDPVQDSSSASSEVPVAPVVNAPPAGTEAQTGDGSMAGVGVPEELQIPESKASCRRAGGVCTSASLCFGSGRDTKPISCPGQNVCCVP